MTTLSLQKGITAFQQLFARIDDASLIIKDGFYIDCNVAALALTGYPDKASIINVSPSETSPEFQPDGERSVQKAKRMMALAIQNGQHHFEWERLRYDGTTLVLDVSLTPIVLDGEEYIHVLWRDRLGRVSQKQIDSMQQFIENMGDAHVILKDGIYTECNQAAVDLLGYPDKKTLLLKGRDRENFYPVLQSDGRKSHEKVREMMARIRTEGSYTFDWTYKKFDGSLIQVSLMGAYTVVDGEEIFHIVWRDIAPQLAAQSDSIKELLGRMGDAALLVKDNKYVDCNQAAIDLLAYPDKQSLLNMHPTKISPDKQPDGRSSFEKSNEIMSKGYLESSNYFEWTHLKYDGSPIMVEAMLTPVSINNEDMIHVIWRDLTDINKQKSALADSEQRYKSIFDDSADATLILEAGRFTNCNDAAVQMFGFDNKEQLLSTKTIELSPVSQPDGIESIVKARECIATTYNKGTHRFEWMYQRKDAQTFPVEVVMTAIIQGGRKIIHFVMRDITEFKSQQRELRNLAHYDVLTGLPNRVLFADRFALAIAHSRRTETQLAVCFLDLDNFKLVNDGYGHGIGDELLKQVAARISATIRDEDTVSRQGGDEFALLLGELKSYQQCENLINRVLYTLSEPFIIGDNTHLIGASCGITLYPSDDNDIDILLRHADHAMYDAKISGKNRFAFFDANTELLSQEHTHFLAQVSQAIDDIEFVLFYQPKINMKTGEMFGAEALIRWQKPEEGLLSPVDFLPKIESSQVMVDLGNWVINAALTQLEQWCKEGKRWVVSINIDAYHFMQESFFEDLKQALERHSDVPSELFEIEILETIAFDDMAKVSKLIYRCQTLGVSFALDDFGTGYSSLTYLKRLPVQWLKIDRTFVRDILDDEEDFAIVEGIISLAKAFKRDVIAEGVESTEHGTALMALGCYNAQGFGIAKPMPAESVTEWDSSYQPDKIWTHHAKLGLIGNEL